jgi:hypothetical protein
MQSSSSTSGTLAIDAPSSYQCKVLDELLHLHSEVDAFDPFHAFIGVFLFEMSFKFLFAFFEGNDISVLPCFKIESGFNSALSV